MSEALLAAAQFTPLFLAVLICWIFSVCVHEFAHALVAYLGGDTSVRDRGYLKFNVFAYIHPVTSILIPAIFLAMGGLPLPGGAVYIETHRLRSRHWAALVAAAGPLSNFLLFFLLAALVHPGAGLIDPDRFNQPMWATLLGALTVLQLYSVLFNLLPVPPLDGYGVIEPYLPPELQEKGKAIGWGGLFILFMIFRSDAIQEAFMNTVISILDWFGLPFESTCRAYNVAFFGSSE